MSESPTMTSPGFLQFHPFPKLPPELQLHVWSLAAMTPRRIEVFTEDLRVDTDWSSHTPPPAIMHVCHDARANAPYVKAFSASSSATDKQRSRYIWVNFDIDMIVLLTEGEGARLPEPIDLFAASTSAHHIQRLRLYFSQDCAEHYESFTTFLELKLKPFQSLRELQIVMAESDTQTCHQVISNNQRFGCCSPDNVRFLDMRTELLLTREEVVLASYWRVYAGGILRYAVLSDYDFDHQAEHPWVKRIENLERLQQHSTF